MKATTEQRQILIFRMKDLQEEQNKSNDMLIWYAKQRKEFIFDATNKSKSTDKDKIDTNRYFTNSETLKIELCKNSIKCIENKLINNIFEE